MAKRFEKSIFKPDRTIVAIIYILEIVAFLVIFATVAIFFEF